MLNTTRRNAGCGGLAWDAAVATVASRHSEDMVNRQFFGHTNPDGGDPFDRLHAAHIQFAAAAENLALGPRTAQDALEQWMASPAHRANMLDCTFTHHGVARTGTRWVHIFIRMVRARYGEFRMLVDGETVVDGGALAFVGVPPLSRQVVSEIRARLATGQPGDQRSDSVEH
jgi:hypothetical protein